VGVRVAFLGNDPWSVPALEAISGEPDLEVVVVVTNPPKPAGRGSRPTRTAVARSAERIGVPLAEVDDVRSGAGFEALRSAAPDVLVVVAYGRLLNRELLEIAPGGAINLHFSLLPRWRGAAPVQHALLAGDTSTGVTVMRMDEGLDTGPILNQLVEEIRPEDDAGSLGARLAHDGAMLLTGVLRMLPRGGVHPRPQDGALATAAPRMRPEDRILDWSAPADGLVRRIRALAPEPGAATRFRDEPLKVLAAAVDPHPGSAGPPGAIVSADDRGVLVAAGSGGVRVLDVAPAGRRPMSAAAWARGARFGADERLG